MDDRERQIRQRLKDDLPHYASRCLTIKAKEGALHRLELNRAQLYLHEALEEQLRTRGMIRALVLKGRQQGSSTYVEGRYYHRVTHRKAVSAFILTHHSKATSNLFGMAKRFHKHCPDLVKPHVAYSNATELIFDRLDSRYVVGTAGANDVGRSDTIQYFHGSEVAMWRNAADHKAAVLQTIPRAPGTEIILESTAKGVGTTWHLDCQAAMAGESDFRLIFLPWHWQPEYREAVGEGFQPTEEELSLAATYGLDHEQLAWRRVKVAELGAWRFKQEYPFTPAEAFQAGNEDPFVTPDLASAAVGRLVAPYGHVVLGVDPARKGKDRFVIIARQGPAILPGEIHVLQRQQNTMGALGLIKRMCERMGVWLVAVDEIGMGGPLIDRLEEMGIRCVGVKAGGTALDSSRYHDIRTEMYADTREWLKEGSIPAGSTEEERSLTQALLADLSALSYDYDSNGREKLESKEDAAKRGMRSPDLSDALAHSIIGPRIYLGDSISVSSF